VPRRVFGLLPLLVLLGLWQAVSWAQIYPSVLLPAPAGRGGFRHRVVVGVSLAFGFAVPLGLLIGRYQILDVLADWSIQIFRSVPPSVSSRSRSCSFGIGDKPAIVLIFLAATWPLLINTIFGVRSIERTLIKVARAARASELLIFRDIILPSPMPRCSLGCASLSAPVGSRW
jgi:NitT/TauT family transport system permease protein